MLVKTVAVGGHFLTFQMLAQTEVTRTFNIKHGVLFMNRSHDGIECTLCQMALSLRHHDNHKYSSMFHAFGVPTRHFM